MYHQRQQRFGRSNNRNTQGRNNFRSQGRRRIKTIDPRFFVQRAVLQESEIYSPQNSFSDFNFHPQLMQNIVAKGYTTLTPIQDQAIPHLLQNRDVVGIASTGTGKTAAFLLPLINKLAKNPSEKVLIVAPTRELAVQIQDELKVLTRNMHIYSCLCIGGVSMRPQVQMLYKNPQFVIGTPGRLQDLERQRKLSFNVFNNIVLDEVDRMLDMGFVREVTYIVSKLRRPRQSLFFSATMPSSVKQVMQGFLTNPVIVEVAGSKPSTNVDQDIVRLKGRNKTDVLHELLNQNGFDKVLVFGRTKHGIEKLSKDLAYRGLKVAAIHGNKSQGQRQRAITQFKGNQIQALLATDVASRGIDISNVTHVINYDQPESYEDYIHRIGRTGRANQKGTALTFVD